MNKWSNNVMAKQIYLTLGAATAGAPGTEEKAFAAIQKWLLSRG